MFIMYIYVTGVLDKVPNTIFFTKTKQKNGISGRLSHPLPWSHSSLLHGQVAQHVWRKAELLSAGRGTVWHDSPGNQTHSLGEM